MWHPITCQRTDTCRHSIGSHHPPYCHASSPCHLPRHSPYAASSEPCKLLTSSRATCHPSSGDMCHLGIGPAVCPKHQIFLPCVTLWSHHVSCTDLPRVACADMPRQHPYGLYGLHSQLSQNFCLFGSADRM
jgi:hypothetical protein